MKFQWKHLLLNPTTKGDVALSSENFDQIIKERFGSSSLFPSSMVDKIATLFAFCGVDIFDKEDAKSNRVRLPELKRQFGSTVDKLLSAVRSGTRFQQYEKTQGNGIAYYGRSTYSHISADKLNEFIDYAAEKAGQSIADKQGDVTLETLKRTMSSEEDARELLKQQQLADQQKLIAERNEYITGQIRFIEELQAGAGLFSKEFFDALVPNAKEALGGTFESELLAEINGSISGQKNYNILNHLKAILETNSLNLPKKITAEKNLNLRPFLERYVFAGHVESLETGEHGFKPRLDISALRDPELRQKIAKELASTVGEALERYGKTETKTDFALKLRSRGFQGKATDMNSFIENAREGGLPGFNYQQLEEAAIRSFASESLGRDDLIVLHDEAHNLFRYSHRLTDRMIDILEEKVKAQPAEPRIPVIKIAKNDKIEISYSRKNPEDNKSSFAMTINDGKTVKETEVNLLPGKTMDDFLESLQARAGRMKPERLDAEMIAEIAGSIPQGKSASGALRG